MNIHLKTSETVTIFQPGRARELVTNTSLPYLRTNEAALFVSERAISFVGNWQCIRKEGLGGEFDVLIVTEAV